MFEYLQDLMLVANEGEHSIYSSLFCSICHCFVFSSHDSSLQNHKFWASSSLVLS